MLTGRFGERNDGRITDYGSMSIEHLSPGHKRVIGPDMFEFLLSSIPPQVRQQQQLINMKVDQEDVERPSLATEIVPFVPSAEDLSCQRDGCYCWSNSNTEVFHRKLELCFYGTPGEENSPVDIRSDDAEAVDFPEMKLDRHVSSSVPTAVVQEHQQHPEAILLDDKFLFEELPKYSFDEYDRSVSPPPCGDDSRRGSQERGVSTAVSQSLPLPEIKRNVLCSIRIDEDSASLTPSSSSSVPAETTRQHCGSLKNINETSDWNKQQQQGTSATSKRGRGCDEHNWLPSDLLDSSQSDERRNGAKRARRNDGEERDSQERSTQLITDDSVLSMKEPSGQLDVNQCISSDPVTSRTIDDSADRAVGQCYSKREQILTTLNTFDQVRQQIIKDSTYGQALLERVRHQVIRDPTYGQALLDSSQTTTDRSEGKSKRVRADLKAARLMRENGLWINERVRPIGDVSGVVIGDCFRYRIEMAVIGLHRALQAGIAVVPLEFSAYGKPVACSVIFGVSDYYQDDKDMGEMVEYSGQGGLCNRTRESQDQKLERGNLALSNSYELKLPVRFIRGHKQQDNMTGILYSYDGLYQVVDMNYMNGVNGKKVFKFLMKRLPGQPPLGSQVPIREPPQVRGCEASLP